MTGHARAEMVRARRSLRGAWLLHAEGLHEDAISRSYYAALPAAKAALLALGIMAESHAAVRRLFGKELVLAGRLEAEWSGVLANQQDQRAMADCDAEARWEEADAKAVIQGAEAFVERIARYLDTAGTTGADADREGKVDGP